MAGVHKAPYGTLRFRLRRLHSDAIPVPEEGRGILEKLQLLTSREALVVYTFLFIPKDHLNALELAKEVGAPSS